jgi:hypothetical protein
MQYFQAAFYVIISSLGRVEGSADKRWGQIVVESRKMPIFAAWKRQYMNN